MEEKIKEVIDNYLIAQNTDYAIMINGKWGCGKTYFVRNVLFDYINKNDSYGTKYECVYVSLYGLNNVGDIGERIFFAINKSYKWIGFVSKRVASFASVIPFCGDGIKSSLELDDNEKNEIHKKLGNLSNKVIFFDDLERISKNVNLLEVLGFINNYSENEKYKTIIICNNEKIDDEDYKKFIEKTVRYAIKYSPNIAYIYDEIVGESNFSDKFKEYLMSNKDRILKIYSRTKFDNIRTLKFIVESLSIIYSKISIITNNEYVNEIFGKIITYYIVYSAEYKNACDEKNLSELNNICNSFWRLTNSNNDNIFLNKYNDIVYDFNHYPIIENYIHNGCFNDDELKNLVKSLYSEIKREEETVAGKLLKKINSLELIEDDELDEIYKNILVQVNNDEYRINDLLNVYICLIRLDSMGFIKIGSNKKFYNLFKGKIVNAFKNGYIMNDLDFQLECSMQYDSDELKNRYKPLLDYAREKNIDIFAIKKKEEINKIIEYINHNDFNGIAEYMSFGNRDKLTSVNVDKLSKSLIKSNKDTRRQFRYCFWVMYPQNWQNPNVSVKEKDFLLKLKTNISNYIAKKKKKVLSDRYLIMLVDDIDKRIKEYFSTVY